MKAKGKKVAVIGSGFAGLAGAAVLAKHGMDVTLLEKNNMIGGRARELQLGGYRFEMGPSWYWMPEVFESFYKLFGYTRADLYTLKRLDPAYRLFKSRKEFMDIPASFEELKQLFESKETGSAKKLENFIERARIKYELGMGKFARKPARSALEFIELDVLKNLFKLDLIRPISKTIDTLFKDPVLRELLKFPVLFLGARPEKTPALFSMMNYADLKLGTWYPEGGMYTVIKAFEKIALEQGVKILTGTNVEKLNVNNRCIESLNVNGENLIFDLVLATSDYQFTEMNLVPESSRSYSAKYWETRQLSPSALLFYIGLDCKIPGILHHNLFFDEDFNRHAREIYDSPGWPEKPLFYVSSPSKSDESVAPSGCDNLVVLIPVAAGLEEKKDTHKRFFDLICTRIEKIVGMDVKNHMVEFQSFGIEDFKKEYNAFKGNAYGLANTLKQTAIFRPSVKSKKVKNLYFAGQLTVPGPGVPPAIISGELVAIEMLKDNG